MKRSVRIAVIVALGAGAAAALAIMVKRERARELTWQMYRGIHDLAVSQEAYFADHAKYATERSALHNLASGATVQILSATDTSWAAVVTDPQTSETCSVSHTFRRGASRSEIGAARVATMKGYVCTTPPETHP